MSKIRHLFLVIFASLAVMCIPATAAFADEVFNVSNGDELQAAVDQINAAGSGEFTISIENDIASKGMNFNKATTVTILGNGHTLDFGSYRAFTSASSERNSSAGPVVNLGSPNATSEQNALEIVGGSRGEDPFILVGDYNGGSRAGALNMEDGVVIRDANGDNTLGGGVFIGGGGAFTMNGGAISNCGIRSGSVSYGGGVAVLNGGTFIMNGGAIEDCYVTQAYCESRVSNNLFFNYAAGGGVFVGNGSYFEMNGGKISGCEIRNRSDISQGYGIGGGVAVLPVYSAEGYGNGKLTSVFVMNDGEISGNHSNCAGGGIGVAGSAAMLFGIAAPNPGSSSVNPTSPGLHINGGTVSNNTADGYSGYLLGGGGIYTFMLNGNVSLEVGNAAITGNDAGVGVGGGIELLSLRSTTALSMDVGNCTLVGNSASYGGGIGLYEVSGSCGATFDPLCPTTIYGNSATNGGDDVLSLGATLDNLTEAGDMAALDTGSNTRTLFKGWYWDLEEDDSPDYDYNGQAIPWKRYSLDNAISYDPIYTETSDVYLKMVTETVQMVTVTPVMDGELLDTQIQKVVQGDYCGDIVFAPAEGREITSVKVNGKEIDFKLQKDGSYIFESRQITEDTIVEVSTSKKSDPDEPVVPGGDDDPDKPSDPDNPDNPSKPSSDKQDGSGSTSGSGNGSNGTQAGATADKHSASTGDGLPIVPIAAAVAAIVIVAGGVAIYARKRNRR